MVEHHYLEEAGFLYVRCTEPFATRQIVDAYARLMADASASVYIGMPVFMDFRDVQLTRLATSDIRDLARQRAGLANDRSARPSVSVASDLGSLGMLRMFAIHADLQGVREETNTFVTLDLRQGVEWMLDRCEATATGPDAVIARIEALNG